MKSTLPCPAPGRPTLTQRRRHAETQRIQRIVIDSRIAWSALPNSSWQILFAFGEYFGTLAVKQKMRTRRAIMNHLLRVCAKILAGLLPALPGGFAQAAQPGQTQALVNGNTVFACDLYAQLRNSPGNLFFSPYSVSTALAMTYAGARGNTETQMAPEIGRAHV